MQHLRAWDRGLFLQGRAGVGTLAIWRATECGTCRKLASCFRTCTPPVDPQWTAAAKATLVVVVLLFCLVAAATATGHTSAASAPQPERTTHTHEVRGCRGHPAPRLVAVGTSLLYSTLASLSLSSSFPCLRCPVALPQRGKGGHKGGGNVELSAPLLPTSRPGATGSCCPCGPPSSTPTVSVVVAGFHC